MNVGLPALLTDLLAPKKEGAAHETQEAAFLAVLEDAASESDDLLPPEVIEKLAAPEQAAPADETPAVQEIKEAQAAAPIVAAKEVEAEHAKIREGRAEVTVGEGADEVALTITTHKNAVHLEAKMTSPALAAELVGESRELRDALRRHGLELVSIAGVAATSIPKIDKIQPSRAVDEEDRDDHEPDSSALDRVLQSLRVMA